MYTFKHFFNYNGFILFNLGFMPLVHAFKKKKTSQSQETKYGKLYFKAPTMVLKVTLGSGLVTFPRAQSNGDKNCSFIPSFTLNKQCRLKHNG